MTHKQNGISVLFASPDALTREMLTKALSRHAHFHVAASATTGQEVLEAVQSAEVDVALIAATLTDGPLSGFRVLRQISECAPQVRSVILFFSSERDLVVDAFRAGAKGVFCLSQSSFKELCRCVEKIHEGQIWGNCAEISEVIETFSQLTSTRVVNTNGMRLLTKREEEVVHLVAEGLQNREIAKALKLSEHTIKNYLFHIFEKLGVSSRVELVLYAVSSAKSVQTAEVQSDKQERKPAGSMEIGDNFLTDANQGSGAKSSRSRRKKPTG
jgi:DNA-binding NarL/FixJ family response regulator